MSSPVSTAPAAAPVAAPAAVPHPARDAWRMFLRSRAALAGTLLLACIVAVALFGPMVYDADPFAIVAAPQTPPGDPDAWLGTDQLGRDVLAGLVYGGRASLAVGVVAAVLSALIGLTAGALAGYYGGGVDEALTRVMEFFQVLPALLFAMVLVTLFSPSLTTISLAIGITSWTATARLTRAEFMRLRDLDFVRAERAIGAGNARIIWRVILPNALPPLVVSGTMAIGSAILFEAGLSFLGLGDPNRMSWGLMIGSARPYLLTCWWAVVFPGLAIFASVLSISLIGDGLNDALNPKLRER
ncbi:ABC transporter permease [Cupriavidus basilensis]|uniref:ABC transporter permease n=1 Tax=Cupriavidus basilensis TaxID=68895 RepID=UPI000750F879|nr:ABC transporter permease [Cupriavidus basilensis]